MPLLHTWGKFATKKSRSGVCKFVSQTALLHTWGKFATKRAPEEGSSATKKVTSGKSATRRPPEQGNFATKKAMLRHSCNKL